MTFNSMLDRPWKPEPKKFTDDNKTGWVMLNQLSTKSLTPKEGEFVASLMRQILERRARFTPSAKQWAWVRDIWWKYNRTTEAKETRR